MAESMTGIIVAALLAAAIGAAFAWLLLKSAKESAEQTVRAEAAGQTAAEAKARAVAEDRASRIPVLEGQIRDQNQEMIELRARNAELTAQLAAAQRKAQDDVALLLEAKEALTEQFQNLANRIFEERGAKFVAQNQDAMETILKPLRDGLGEFKAKVEAVYDKESKERFSLQNEIKRLVELNSKIGQDAVNLTNALKGQSKTQGNWGELVLERVLEGSGLQKGREYDVQVSVNVEGGGRLQPDVIVRLPEGKNIIVDSKVSLTAYDEYCSSETEAQKADALARHIASVRGHISGLSGKNYQSLYGVKSLDFVLMFMPIEPAFMLAMESDKDLYTDAFQKNIMIVGPWNLLVSLKTIASIWRYEYQNRNAQELARQCAALYDKFVGFVADLEDVGKRLEAARGSYDTALGKLSTGKGNLVRQVERIRQLGVKPSKLLPPPLVDAAMERHPDEED
jgi:DNA recombination protein RmuC